MQAHGNQWQCNHAPLHCCKPARALSRQQMTRRPVGASTRCTSVRPSLTRARTAALVPATEPRSWPVPPCLLRETVATAQCTVFTCCRGSPGRPTLADACQDGGAGEGGHAAGHPERKEVQLRRYAVLVQGDERVVSRTAAAQHAAWACVAHHDPLVALRGARAVGARLSPLWELYSEDCHPPGLAMFAVQERGGHRGGARSPPRPGWCSRMARWCTTRTRYFPGCTNSPAPQRARPTAQDNEHQWI